MPDRLTLSCWLRGYENPAAGTLMMLTHWEKLLKSFPYSKLQKGFVTVLVHAVGESEPVLFEHAYPIPFNPEQAIAVARDFQQPDCAYQVDCSWDLMQFDRDWKLAPSKVSLWCYGPGYDNETGDQLRIEFGPEDPFLPARNEPISVRVAQSNLRSLTKLVNDIEKTLPLEKRMLWSESGQNFAERVARLMAGGSGSGLQ